ncbi:MAG TPA: CDP-alcohol phosphatidyltransferase family protein [Actinomycetota bacterium]|jgi:phosphatidylglycerophosphate synthase|nr:CDP-alcohol phosphatidyltransferase family protein [Actinomycetota bacterium]
MIAPPALALSADGLTAARALLGPVLASLVATGRLSAAAVVLGVAWISDALDGRLARASGGLSRLGNWDFPADVVVGAGILAGLALAGAVPLPLAVLVLVGLGSAFLVLRNPALGMAVQAIGYGAFLWRLWVERVAAGWIPVAVAAGIGLLERRRFVRVVLPSFFRGVASALRLRRHDTFRLPEG